MLINQRNSENITYISLKFNLLHYTETTASEEKKKIKINFLINKCSTISSGSSYWNETIID